VPYQFAGCDAKLQIENNRFEVLVGSKVICEYGMCLAPTYASEKILQNSFRPKISSNITAIFFNWDYG
jgi:hypothetical protein